MKLYLVRHGDALSPDIDPNCPLSQKGILETERMSKLLKNFHLDIKYVYYSVKERAKQTAEILMPQATLVEKEGLKPNDPIAPILEEIVALEETIMIVGHLPFLENLVQELHITGLQSFVFDNTSILALEKSIAWELCWALSPKIFY